MIERKTSVGGVYAVIGEMQDATSYLDSGLVGGTTYYYRVKAHNYGGDSGYSAEASATTPSSGIELPLADLELWLKADAGIVYAGTNAAVRFWLDQSGKGHNASASATAAQPKWIADVLEGKPVLRFDGTSDSFALPNVFTSLSEAEVFVVLKAVTNAPSGSRGLWKFGAATTASYYPHSTRAIYDAFGRTDNQNTGEPAQRIDFFHLYNVSSVSGEWTARLNGKLHYQDANTSVGFTTSPSIGQGGSAYFAGDMAEVMLFNRVLSAEEREAVGSYLNQRYRWIDAPEVPAGLEAAAISTNQVSLTWTNLLGTATTAFIIERKTGEGGTYAVVAEPRDATSYLDGGLAEVTTYYYRIKARNYGGESGYSGEVSVTALSTGTELPFGDLQLWLKADGGVVFNAAGDRTSFWLDGSGQGNHATATSSGLQSLWVDQALNGRPVLRFDAGDYFNLPDFMTTLTEAEVFVVLKAATNNPAGNHALWRLGNSGFASYYPQSTGYIADDFGSTASKDQGTPLQDIGQYHLYSVSSVHGFWQSWINGMAHFATDANGIAFPTAPRLGYGGTLYGWTFDGDLAEILLFNRSLSAEEHDTVGIYLNEKYAFVSAAAPVPGGFLANAITPQQIDLSWTNAVVTNGLLFTVERKTGSGGAYVPIGTVRDDHTYADFGVVPGTNYYYRVKSWSYTGESDYSAEISPPSGTITLPGANSILASGTNVVVQVTTADLDGAVASVEYRVNEQWVATNSASPFSATLPNLERGVSVILAKIIDDQGNSAYAAAVGVIVPPDTDGETASMILPNSSPAPDRSMQIPTGTESTMPRMLFRSIPPAPPCRRVIPKTRRRWRSRSTSRSTPRFSLSPCLCSQNHE